VAVELKRHVFVITSACREEDMARVSAVA
jgi:hypothetical protein